MSLKIPVISKYEWQRAAKSILSIPPLAPIKGDRYIIGLNPTGDWVNNANKIAEYNDSSWEFTFPFPGMIIFLSTKNKLYKYNNNIWNDLIVAGGDTVVIESTGRQLTVDDLNLTLDCNSSSTQIYTLPEATTQCIGGWFRFVKTNIGSIIIQSGINDRIADSGIGDTIYCDAAAQDFATLKILCIKVGLWVITGGHGTWTTTESG